MECSAGRTVLLTAILLSLVKINFGGSCWRNSGRPGTCGRFLRHKVTFEQCCQTKGVSKHRDQTGYSDMDAKDSRELFFLRFVRTPRVCKRCSTLCGGENCGSSPCTKKGIKKARCVCNPDCTNTYQAKVCSTNQLTYPNECALLRAKCQLERKINVDYYSECKASCKNIRCPNNKICVVDQYRVPHCVTNAICKMKCRVNLSRDKMLCGTNGVTYLNLCLLRQAVCHLRNGKSIGIAYQGSCKKLATCNNIKCSGLNKCLSDKMSVRCVKCKHFCMGGFHLQNPVCGSNLVTFKNWCSLRRAACHSGKHIEVRKNGPC